MLPTVDPQVDVLRSIKEGVVKVERVLTLILLTNSPQQQARLRPVANAPSHLLHLLTSGAGLCLLACKPVAVGGVVLLVHHVVVVLVDACCCCPVLASDWRIRFDHECQRYISTFVHLQLASATNITAAIPLHTQLMETNVSF